MNTYEFWNDIDKIYDAIMAYQEKTIEFNKRFINPWVNLSNIFDKKESNEAIVAHKNSIEIDPENAKNWYELANTYTRLGDFDKSIYTFQKAIELGYETGEVYKNLALAYAMTARPQEAIHLFRKALTLLVNDKDKAIVWNQLGNVYRKLNNYEMALQAFQQADQLEGDLSSLLKEQTEQTLIEGDDDGTEILNAHDDNNNASRTTDKSASVLEGGFPPDEQNEESLVSFEDSGLEIEQTTDLENEISDEALEEDKFDNFDDNMPVVLEIDFSEQSFDSYLDETTVQIEPNTESLAILEKANEDSTVIATSQVELETNRVASEKVMVEENLTIPAKDEIPNRIENSREEAKTEDTTPAVNSVAEFLALLEEDEKTGSGKTVQKTFDFDEAFDYEEEPAEKTNTKLKKNNKPDFLNVSGNNVSEIENEDIQAVRNHNVVSLIEEDYRNNAVEESLKSDKINNEVEPTLESDATFTLSAYEEYLKDTSEPINNNRLKSQLEENQTTAMTTAEVNATSSELSMDDTNADLTVDMDTKNANVWNELGNVYFNAGSLDDAIAAYSRAIELDKQFAWPYSNLAMAYVQKERMDEAILLYQRSIELFSNERDKAVAWNHLGDVYRRLNNYENAIAAYQRADDLDPGNAVVKHQTKFSLLGSKKVDHEVGYSI